jgi:outer membrane protein OmpA-like peptidoglycan-associated protein
MDARKTPAPRIASRTAVMAAVAVLIVIAIAGIVLASLRRAPAADAEAVTDSTQATAPAPTAAAPANDGAPNEVIFAAASDQLTPAAQAKLALFAEQAKKDGRPVVVATQIEANTQRAENMDLAKRRAYKVRSALVAGGVAVAVLRIEVAELPAGGVPAAAAQRVEVNIR